MVERPGDGGALGVRAVEQRVEIGQERVARAQSLPTRARHALSQRTRVLTLEQCQEIKSRVKVVSDKDLQLKTHSCNCVGSMAF